MRPCVTVATDDPVDERAICSISGSLIPQVVTAGVPGRMPLVTNGDWVSFGTVFLFSVMPAASSAFSATFPVTFLLRRSISIRWLSVPPDTRLKPYSMSALARACALRTI
jgi:hypothetical protein